MRHLLISPHDEEAMIDSMPSSGMHATVYIHTYVAQRGGKGGMLCQQGVLTPKPAMSSALHQPLRLRLRGLDPPGSRMPSLTVFKIVPPQFAHFLLKVSPEQNGGQE